MKDAKPDTWMPLVIGDYLKDTSRLRAEHHGAYLLLIMEYWVNGPPADDDLELAAVAACDLKDWKRIRPKIQRFFRVEDGIWRHKRVEEELARWAEKKAAYAARAAAGGRAKAAKSTASSTRKAVLEGCLKAAPQPASGEEEASYGASSLTGGRFQNENLREAAVELAGEPFVQSYLDACRWQDVPEPAIIAPREFTARKLVNALRPLLKERGVSVEMERAA